MPTLTITDLPEPLHERLKAQAVSHGRSLNSEIIVCLERAVMPTRLRPADWLADVRAFQASLGIEPLSDRQLQKARRSGRS